MSFVIGAAIVVASFFAAFGTLRQPFDGFFHLPSAILLVFVPLGLAIATHPFSMIGEALRGLAWAISRDLTGEHRRTRRRIAALARAVRAGRGGAASDALGGSRDAVFVMLAERVVRRASSDEIESDGVALARDELDRYEAAEKLLSGLGEYAPGVGMIGTVIGLVELLANMSDLARLGPAMALALLTTFYGLVLTHALYLPLARLSATQARRRTADLNQIIASLKKIAADQPIHEIDQVLGVRSDTLGIAAAAPGTPRLQ